MNQPAASREATVLIAEDSIIQAAMLKRTLSAAGYRVLVAKDGAEALREAEGDIPALLITDVVMPEMNGFELCRSLRARTETAQLPILLLTTLSSPEDILEGLAAGADDYLVKPYQDQAILDKVAAMLGIVNSEDRAFTGLDEIPFVYHGRDYAIPFRPQTTLRVLMSTYEHAIEQNKALVAAREEITLINRELERKVAERTAELAAANQRLEQSLRELYSTEEQLMQSEKLSAIGEMVGGIVHEINNPVMGAINYVQFAIEQSRDEELTDFLRKAEERIRQVSKLVEAMLGYVHHGDQRLESVDLAKAVDATIALMGPELKTQGVELSLQLSDSLPPVTATDVGIQQVCANLIKNAVDAMADSGGKRITISAAPSAAWVSLAIEDTGAGIAGELRDKIFQPFFTTKPKGKGTGLGLAICQRIMRANGGEILYEPVEGRPDQPAGARFVVRFLRSEPATSQHLSAGTADP